MMFAMRKLLIGATAALVLSLAPVAQATPGQDAHVIVKSVFSIPDGGTASVLNPCPSGETALGGGIRTVGVFSGNSMRANGPASPEGGLLVGGQTAPAWSSHAFNQSGNRRTFHNYAICSPSSDGTVVVGNITTAATDTGVQGSTTVPCPAGQRVIGGGVAPTSAGGGSVEASGPLDGDGSLASTTDGDVGRSWYVSMLSTGAQTFRAYAICSPTSTATIQVESMTLGPGTSNELNAFCPTGQRALSGGVINNATYAWVTATTPGPAAGSGYLALTETVGYGWWAHVNNFTAPANSSTEFKVAAICEGPPSTTPPTNPPGPTDPTNPTNPTNPGAPSNDFQIGGLARNRERGTAKLSVTLPGAGVLSLESPKFKPQQLSVAAAGEYRLKVKAAAASRKKLRRKGKVKSTAEVTFAPAGGTAASQDAKVKLVRD